AALYHDIAYSEKGTFTHDHVGKSIDQAEAILKDLSERQPVLDITPGDIDDILLMIAPTSITPLPFESQGRVKELRERGLSESNPSLIRMKNILLAADLVGVATTPEYTSELIPLYREFAVSVRSDIFGSALQLLAGTNGFQKFFANGTVLKNVMQDGEKVDDFLKDIFTEEQLTCFAEHMKTAEIIREIYDGLKEGKTVDETEENNPIERLEKRKDLFVGPNMPQKEKRGDFNNTVFLLRMMNRMVRGESFTEYMAQRLRDLRKDPAFECDASIVLLHILTQDAEGLTDGQIKTRLPKIKALLARIGELRARKKTNGEITYSFDRFYGPTFSNEAAAKFERINKAVSDLVRKEEEITARLEKIVEEHAVRLQNEIDRIAREITEANVSLKESSEATDKETDGIVSEEDRRLLTQHGISLEMLLTGDFRSEKCRTQHDITKAMIEKGFRLVTGSFDGITPSERIFLIRKRLEDELPVIRKFGVDPEMYVEMRRFYGRDEIETRLRILESCAHDEITLEAVANAELIKAGQEARKIPDIIRMSAEIEAAKRILAELKRENAEKIGKRLSPPDRFYFAVVCEYDGWLAAKRKTDPEPALEEKVTHLFRAMAGALANAADTDYGLGSVEALTGRRIEVLRSFALRAILAAENEAARSEQFIEAAKKHIDEALERFFVPGKGERESKSAAEVKTRMRDYLGGENTPSVRDFITLTFFGENAPERHAAFFGIKAEVTDISGRMGEVLVNLTFLEFQAA
ncbi:MAG: hypothetical protein ABIH74_06185, partial [Candidatus Omnitrophota bacterium]